MRHFRCLGVSVQEGLLFLLMLPQYAIIVLLRKRSIDMAKPLRYDAVLRARITSDQFHFLKAYAARYNTDMSQVVRDYIGRLEKSERRRGRKEAAN